MRPLTSSAFPRFPIAFSLSRSQPTSPLISSAFRFSIDGSSWLLCISKGPAGLYWASRTLITDSASTSRTDTERIVNIRNSGDTAEMATSRLYPCRSQKSPVSPLFLIFTILSLSILLVDALSVIRVREAQYRPAGQGMQRSQENPSMLKRNAELINGLVGWDLDRLTAMGKRGNAELVNGLIGMDLSRLSTMGRRR